MATFCVPSPVPRFICNVPVALRYDVLLDGQRVEVNVVGHEFEIEKVAFCKETKLSIKVSEEKLTDKFSETVPDTFVTVPVNDAPLIVTPGMIAIEPDPEEVAFNVQLLESVY